MKNTISSIKKHLILKYTSGDQNLEVSKSTNINVLLDRVKLDQRRESRKKLLFTAVTSVGVLLFGVIIF